MADNGSTDSTLDIARRWSGRLPLRVVDASDRKGANHARNVGATSACGDFIAFCDADDVASPSWLEGMADAARSFHLVGGPLEITALNDPNTARWRHAPPQDGLSVHSHFLPYARSANFGIRADVLRELGGWNEDYDRGAEEVELCWRAQLAGHNIGFAPEAVMHYRYRPTPRDLARQYYDYGRSGPQLFRAFRGEGMPRTSAARAALAWGWLVVHVFDLARSQSRRAEWMRRFASRCGRLAGSLRFRVLFL
jgi:GT2 family glycosyltransferase